MSARHTRRAVTRHAAWVALMLIVTSTARSQAICSAPHSSPTLAAGRSIGTLDPGTGWVMVSALHQASTEIFNPQGNRQPFLAGGRFRTASLYLSAGAGVTRGLDLWAQAPIHNMHYQDSGGERTRAGIGDIRLALRVSPALFGRSFPVALRAGVKLPGSTFPVDATVIPLTEGQRDAELSVESGGTFFNRAFYVLGWSGYRWRTENREAARQPGNEAFGHLAAGTAISGIRIELGSDLLVGEAPRQLGVEVTSARRRIVQLSPTLSRKVGVGDLEFTTVLPVAGRNLPTGPGLSVGYRVGWGAHAAGAPRAKAFAPRDTP